MLELTWLKDHTAPYELGENESHLCFRVAGDYDAIRAYHKEMNCVCFENTAMGLYFINDPDDYWIRDTSTKVREVVPKVPKKKNHPYYNLEWPKKAKQIKKGHLINKKDKATNSLRVSCLFLYF